MSKPLTAVSLFSGCGGFDWGAAQAGVKIIWANDCDPAAAAAYRSLFPAVKFHEGDIREVEEFPKADVLIGCYPCTGFSEAAKRNTPHSNKERDLRENPGKTTENQNVFLKIFRGESLFFWFSVNNNISS